MHLLNDTEWLSIINNHNMIMWIMMMFTKTDNIEEPYEIYSHTKNE
jgi:hypothetical protein